MDLVKYGNLSGGRGGGVAVRVVVAAASLVLLGAAIFLLTRSFEADKADDHRRATAIAEYGLQRAFMALGEDWNWNAGFRDEAYDGDEAGGGTFSVSVSREDRGDTMRLNIVSIGRSGSITRSQERAVTLRLEVSEEGDSTWLNEGIR
jgi:hypothetical protein